MNIASRTKSKFLRGAAAAAFLAAALTPISAYATDVTDLYVLQGEELYRVSESTGGFTLIGTNDDWAGFTSIVSDQGISIQATGAYAVQGGSIWHVSFDQDTEGDTILISDDGWTGPTQLAYGAYPSGFLSVASLIAWQGGHLYKVNTGTGVPTQLGSASWSGQAAMTYLNHNNNADGNDLFVVRAGTLWRVNVNTGSRSAVGGGDWSDTTAMTTDGTTLYIACQDHLYKANPWTGSSTDLGPAWNTTTTLTFFNNWLYAIDGGDLFQVNPSTGSTTLLGSENEWPGFTLMTYRDYPIIQ